MFFQFRHPGFIANCSVSVFCIRLQRLYLCVCIAEFVPCGLISPALATSDRTEQASATCILVKEIVGHKSVWIDFKIVLSLTRWMNFPKHSCSGRLRPVTHALLECIECMRRKSQTNGKNVKIKNNRMKGKRGGVINPGACGRCV